MFCCSSSEGMHQRSTRRAVRAMYSRTDNWGSGLFSSCGHIQPRCDPGLCRIPRRLAQQSHHTRSRVCRAHRSSPGHALHVHFRHRITHQERTERGFRVKGTFDLVSFHAPAFLSTCSSVGTGRLRRSMKRRYSSARLRRRYVSPPTIDSWKRMYPTDAINLARSRSGYIRLSTSFRLANCTDHPVSQSVSEPSVVVSRVCLHCIKYMFISKPAPPST